MAGYITVLLQKSNPAGDWGFRMGPVEPAASVVITQIDESCVAAELLEPGDKIIEIDGKETSKMSVEELQGLLGNPSKRLSMVVHKKNLPKGNCSVRKTTTEEVSTVEETREEVERKKEYEVVLELSPSESAEEVMKSIKEKIQRGEKLDAKEVQITSSLNKNIQTSTATVDTTKQRIERDFGSVHQKQMLDKSRNSEILKRKEKFIREQKKEEMVRCEKMVKEQQIMEEKKKKSSTFWTDPPSDLKSAINSSKNWQHEDSGENYSTSAIFSHLNDLHNTLRKGSARDEKQQFWENCRRKYGWDPPAMKYNLRNRPNGAPVNDLRSRSCEPEHLDSQNPFKREDYRQTNPFFSPSPTNPFYAECSSKSQSEENLRSSTELAKSQKLTTNVNQKVEDGLQQKGSVESGSNSGNQEYGEKMQQSNEAYHDDFQSKYEFFERASSVPTTSCVKNAQDIVSERLGSTQNTQLKKPSDFINEVQSQSRKAALSRSNSKEEKVPEPERHEPHEEERPSASQVDEDVTETTGNTQSEHKAFLGQSVLRQSVTGSTNTSSKATDQADLAQIEANGNKYGFNESVNKSSLVESSVKLEKKEFFEKTNSKVERKIPLQASSMENEIKNHPLVIAAQQKEFAASMLSDQTDLIEKDKVFQEPNSVKHSFEKMKALHDERVSQAAEAFSASARQIEAQMQESIDMIRAESEKLCSLDVGKVSSSSQDPPAPPVVFEVIPDSTAFPGMGLAAELRKRSFTETSYEKVTRTGTPYENVESACRREFRVATPSGFYENAGREEVFKQESRTEELREACSSAVTEGAFGAAFCSIAAWEGGPQQAYDLATAFVNEGMKSAGNGSMVEAGLK